MNSRKKELIFTWIVLALAMVALWFSIYVSIAGTKDNRDHEIVDLPERASYLNTTQRISNVVKQPLLDMIADAEEDGVCLVVFSGYRSQERQQKVYDDAEDKSIVAVPGTSEHEEGLAIDFAACPMNEKGQRDDSVERLELREPFENLLEYKWLKAYAGRYNFFQSYREDNESETGYPAEAWHWKFNYKYRVSEF